MLWELHMAADRLATVEGDDLVTVARFKNIAEAGFFADALEAAESIRSVLTTVDDFSAVSGNWQAVVHLRVASTEAKRAAAALRELQAATGGDEDQEAPIVSHRNECDSSHSWLPMAAAFAAGSALVFAFAKLDGGGAKDSTGRLMQELLERPEPWVQTLPNGARRELRSGHLKELILRDDLDADGRFERTRSIAGP
jgi:hypothetical protein